MKKFFFMLIGQDFHGTRLEIKQNSFIGRPQPRFREAFPFTILTRQLVLKLQFSRAMRRRTLQFSRAMRRRVIKHKPSDEYRI